MPTATKTRKLNAAGSMRTIRAIKADANGDLPSRIMILRCGTWDGSMKGDLTITPSDLQEFKQNFDNGIGLPANGQVGLPIDFSHNEWAEAAGWMTALDIEGDALYASVDWTVAGKEAIIGGMFKCISPSFYPAARGGWVDPEDGENVVGNVLVGAGLTNIPFFKDLMPVKASASSEDGEKNVIYISASEKEKKSMTLDETRIKAAADLTAEERTFLEAHKEELSGDEKKKFGFEAAQPINSDLSEEERGIVADIRSGKKKVVDASITVIEASRLKTMEQQLKENGDFIEEKRKAEAAAIVKKHINRGALKADASERWTERLLKASAEERKDLEADLEAMQADSRVANGEIGADGQPIVSGSAREQIAQLAAQKVEAAAAEGKVLNYVEAQQQVLASNPDLAEQDRKENKL